MTHLSDEQLVEQYYKDGDVRAATEHLHACEECQTRMDQLNAVLNSVEYPVPERGEDYGASVWHNLKGLLPEAEVRRPWWMLPSTMRWASLGAVAALVLAAFLLGRMTQTPAPQVAVQTPEQLPAQQGNPTAQQESPAVAKNAQQGSVKNASTQSPQVKSRDRILVVAVGDHLERSQMVLAELMNANTGEPVDISTQQKIAGELVSENRLYRQAAQRDRDPSLANLLDELGRVLVDIAHEPSKLSGPELASIKQRIEAQGIVFKVRVVGSQIKRREQKSQTTLGKST